VLKTAKTVNDDSDALRSAGCNPTTTDRRQFLHSVVSAGAAAVFTSRAAISGSGGPAACAAPAAPILSLRTSYARITLDGHGLITSITSRQSGKEYLATGKPSPILSLYENGKYLLSSSARYHPAQQTFTLAYPNGASATVKVVEKAKYFRFQLLALDRRGTINNIVWGPIHTTVSKTIGDIIGVVRDDDWAIGMLALDDRTTQGPPTASDSGQAYYYIHSPDPVKYPVPARYQEGERFPIGGDGTSDVAFYSHPEEYFHMASGGGALLEPGSGSVLTYHARDRRKSYTTFYPPAVDLALPLKQPRHQAVDPVDVDFIGSSVALYACPDDLGLSVIENIVLAEGLPHPTIDGKWVKDPAAYQPDICWTGPHDHLIAYADALGLKGVQDDGMGEFYLDPSDHWDGKLVRFADGRRMTIRQFTDETRQHGIRYGLHTLCMFIQTKSSDVHPVPNEHLQTVLRTKLAGAISPTDTAVTVTDPSFLAEKGTWDDNNMNVLRMGTELLTYDGITTSAPWTLQNVKRGQFGTKASAHAVGDELVKLQINGYHGFIPDMELLGTYADYYAQRLNDLGMEYVDFDGFESCTYQNQGDYAFKVFLRRLFATYHQLSGRTYLRIMGSGVTEGSWHYMSVCNVGGDNNMFDPVGNHWGIEGKDIRYQWGSSYFPITFGIQSYRGDWTMYDAENLQAKSIGWNATYMLGLNQNTVEKSGEKQAIFKAFRAWENGRAANVFTKATKQKLADLSLKFHLEQADEKSFLLSPVKEIGLTEKADNQAHLSAIENPYDDQPLQFALRFNGPRDATVDGVIVTLPGGQQVKSDRRMNSGDFIICKGNTAYVADRFRKKTGDLELDHVAILPSGRTTISVRFLGASAPARSQLQLTVWAVGKAEPVGK
jgi:hypothetical protein